MQAIGFYLALPFLYLISILPFPLLYLFSDFVFVLLYYVIGYRKKVVTENLRNSFPEKSEKEISELCRKFFRYFSDMSLEILKTLTISQESMLRHCRFDESSAALLKKFHEEKKSIIVVLGHLGNWEWGGNAFSIQCKQQLYVIYHPLQNKYFDKLIVGMRTRFGTKLIKMQNTFREMLANKKNINATAFIADQTPHPENAYWATFFNQDTPVFRGTETIARKLNYPIVFTNVKKIKRGYYTVSAEILFENPAALREGEITEMHTRKLEEEIRKQPETWLWSHKRWKHKRVNNN